MIHGRPVAESLFKVVAAMANTEQFNIGYHCTTLQCERGLGERVAMR